MSDQILRPWNLNHRLICLLVKPKFLSLMGKLVIIRIETFDLGLAEWYTTKRYDRKKCKDNEEKFKTDVILGNKHFMSANSSREKEERFCSSRLLSKSSFSRTGIHLQWQASHPSNNHLYITSSSPGINIREPCAFRGSLLI